MKLQLGDVIVILKDFHNQVEAGQIGIITQILLVNFKWQKNFITTIDKKNEWVFDYDMLRNEIKKIGVF